MDAARGRIQHIPGALSSLLPHAHVDRRQSKRCRLHDAAARIADQHLRLAQQAPVLNGRQIDEQLPLARSARNAVIRSDSRAPRHPHSDDRRLVDEESAPGPQIAPPLPHLCPEEA